MPEISQVMRIPLRRPFRSPVKSKDVSVDRSILIKGIRLQGRKPSMSGGRDKMQLTSGAPLIPTITRRG